MPKNNAVELITGAQTVVFQPFRGNYLLLLQNITIKQSTIHTVHYAKSKYDLHVPQWVLSQEQTGQMM